VGALSERVARAVGDSATLDEVWDEVIAPARIDDELKDALWLYAWGLSERRAEHGHEPGHEHLWTS